MAACSWNDATLERGPENQAQAQRVWLQSVRIICTEQQQWHLGFLLQMAHREPLKGKESLLLTSSYASQGAPYGWYATFIREKKIAPVLARCNVHHSLGHPCPVVMIKPPNRKRLCYERSPLVPTSSGQVGKLRFLLARPSSRFRASCRYPAEDPRSMLVEVLLLADICNAYLMCGVVREKVSYGQVMTVTKVRKLKRHLPVFASWTTVTNQLYENHTKSHQAWC